MTLDEAIRHTEDVARIKQEASIYLADEHPTQAEKCEECAKEHRQLAEWLKELKAYKENTCGDAISRQAAIRAIEALQRPIMREESNYYQFKFSGMSEALEAVENLPSVSPKQKTGRWIDIQYFKSDDTYYRPKCPFCNAEPKEYSNYCPDCGAKMEVENG